MTLRNRQEKLAAAHTSYSENTLRCLTEQHFAESKLSSECYRDEVIMQSTCSTSEYQGDDLVGKRKERQQLFHNLNDANFGKYRNSDVLGDIDTSKQCTFTSGTESTSYIDSLVSTKDVENWNPDEEINNEFAQNETNDCSISVIDKNTTKEVFCPVCKQEIKITKSLYHDVNNHIDICLNNKAISNFGKAKTQENTCYDRPSKLTSGKKRHIISPYESSNLHVNTKVPKKNSILNYMLSKHKK